jgi:hypothetical protein
MKCVHCGKDVHKKKKPVSMTRRRQVVRQQGLFNLEYAESLEIEIKGLLFANDHYVHISNKLRSYYELTGYAERTMAHHLGVSKSELHRLILIAYMPDSMKTAAVTYNTEKYVLLEWAELTYPGMKNYLASDIIGGVIRKRKQLKQRIAKYVAEFGEIRTGDITGFIGREGAQA